MKKIEDFLSDFLNGERLRKNAKAASEKGAIVVNTFFRVVL